MNHVQRLRERVRLLKRDVLALYLACRNARTPWYAKAVAGIVVAYALSPVDLIPDFVPVLGYLDDLFVVPAGLVVAVRLIPRDILAQSREGARLMSERPTSRAGLAIIVVAWLAAATFAAVLLRKWLELI